MNFEQAMAEYARLRQGYDSRQISAEEFGRRVQALQVQDSSGNYWAVDGSTGGWLRYDGSNWVPGTPPLPQSPAGPAGGYNAAATQIAPGNSGGFGAQQPQQGGFGQQQSGGFSQPQGGFGGQQAQGGFGAPAQGGFGGQQPGMMAAAPVAKKSNTGRNIGIGCGVIVLLLIVCSVIGLIVSSRSGSGGLLGSIGGSSGLTEAATAKTINSDKRPDQKTTDFTASSQMYITYTARKVKKGETIDLKLYRDGTKVDLTGSQTVFEKDATYYGYYTYTPSQKGSYKAELYYNGEVTPSQTLTFTVK